MTTTQNNKACAHGTPEGQFCQACFVGRAEEHAKAPETPDVCPHNIKLYFCPKCYDFYGKPIVKTPSQETEEATARARLAQAEPAPAFDWGKLTGTWYALAWTIKGMSVDVFTSSEFVKQWVPTAIRPSIEQQLQQGNMLCVVGEGSQFTFALVFVQAVHVPPEKAQHVREQIGKLHSLAGDLRNIVDALKASA